MSLPRDVTDREISSNGIFLLLPSCQRVYFFPSPICYELHVDFRIFGATHGTHKRHNQIVCGFGTAFTLPGVEKVQLSRDSVIVSYNSPPIPTDCDQVLSNNCCERVRCFVSQEPRDVPYHSFCRYFRHF